VEELRLLPPVNIQIPLLAAIEIIGYIQLGTRDPVTGAGEFAKMAIDVARQLQNSLDPNLELFQLLEFGWELQADWRQVKLGCEHEAELRQKVLSLFDVGNINTDQEV
jgi:hypothetical protein